jgi:glycosyltransferase involved in cell wall biosynthesis
METDTIVFLTSSHFSLDDRIYYHQARSLSVNYKVVIVSSADDKSGKTGNVTFASENRLTLSTKDKIRFFKESLKKVEPQIVICSEPLPIIAAVGYRRKSTKKVKIIYDVTEWYPSKKNIAGMSFFKRLFTFKKLLLYNLLAASHCDGFIFGEYYKSLPFRLVFPWKKWTIVGYYPDLSYINFQESKIEPGKICLGFTGTISREKGIENFFAVASRIKSKRPDVTVKLKIIGRCYTEDEKNRFDKLCREAKDIELEILDKQDFEVFSEKLTDIDVLFDLRKLDFENNHCLAIKVFYYAACGKPVVYSNLKAIRHDIDVSKFGYLVDPTDSEQISDCVLNYIQHPDLYQMHSREARKLAETKYNWQMIEPQFLNFITMFQSRKAHVHL